MFTQKIKKLLTINVLLFYIVGILIMVIAYRGDDKEAYVHYVLLPVLTIILVMLLRYFYTQR